MKFEAKHSKKQIVICLLFILFLVPFTMVGQKVFQVPENLKVEDKPIKETVIRNLAEVEIFSTGTFKLHDDFIYIFQSKSAELVKINLKGDIVARFGQKGEGPKEFSGNVFEIEQYKGQLILLDSILQKLTYLDKNLNYIKETKLPFNASYVMINGDEFFFYGRVFNRDYFTIYDMSFKKLRSLGEVQTPENEIKKLVNFDVVRSPLYIPEEKGLWHGFGNCYDLWYYKNEKLTSMIKGPKDFFKGEVVERPGVKVMGYQDRLVDFAVSKGVLYYLFIKDQVTWCDIFDLGQLQIKKRVRGNKKYYMATHYKDNIFYALRAEGEDDDLILVKLEL